MRWFLALLCTIVALGLLWQWTLGSKDIPLTPGPIALKATVLPLESGAPERTALGPLHFIAAWDLTSTSPSFGGLSAVTVEDDGTLLALSDTGVLTRLGRPPLPGGRPGLRALPTLAQEANQARWTFDSESMARDPVTGQHWVAFELSQRICRYAPDFSRVEACRRSRPMKGWPATGGPESMVRLADGRFIVISELADGPDAGNDMLLFSGDPAERATPLPLRMNYLAPAGYHPTDAVQLDATHLLVLNRRLTLHQGFTAVLALLDISGMKQGAMLRPVELARLAPPVLADNFEGLALERRAGRTLLWVLSDDNHKFFQRTLLLQFALPDDLVAQAGR